jgi:hypothetical protein
VGPLEIVTVTATALPKEDGDPEVVTLSVGAEVEATAFKPRAKLLETPLATAVSVAVCAVVTGAAFAVNVALVAFAATVTVAGTVTAVLLLESLTLTPLLGAAEFSVTVQASFPAPVMDALPQESVFNEADHPRIIPVPVRPTTARSLVEDEELLVKVNCPVASPVSPGLNCTFKL